MTQRTHHEVRKGVRFSIGIVLSLLMGLSATVPLVSSWMVRPIHHARRVEHVLYSSRSSSLNAFGPFGNFLNEGRSRNQTVAFMGGVMDAAMPAGTFRLFQFESKQSNAAVRSFLSDYILIASSSSNTTIWNMDQPDDTVLDIMFYDRSGILSIHFDDEQHNNRITIHRIGSEPSTSYLIQESILLDRILTQLNEHEDHSSLSDIIDQCRSDLSFA